MGPEEQREACGAALASLPEMGPRRLTAVVDAWGLVGAWERLSSGPAAATDAVSGLLGSSWVALGQRWGDAAGAIDPVARREAHLAAGVEVVVLGSDRYPAVLAADREPPKVLFVRGDLARLSGPRVGVVGTRRATSGGRQTAAELGRDLARAGVRVVSGLALGIDGAAHQGALLAAADGSGAAPVVGVVGTGLDVVYPRRHRDLWDRVGAEGVLLSEVPLGGHPTRWRFPARNRLIAALSHLLVVVESHATGGALLTVDEAQERDVPVMAVPGSVRVGACAGTNELLVSGATPALSAADVLAALDLDSCRVAAAPRDPAPDAAAVLEPGDEELLVHLGWEPVGLDRLATRAALSPGELAVRLLRLEAAGRVVRSGGAVEQVAVR